MKIMAQSNREIYLAIHDNLTTGGKTTLVVDNYLIPSSAENGDNLNFPHSQFSRMKLSILDTNSNYKQYVTANLSVSKSCANELALLFDKYDIAKIMLARANLQAMSNEDLPLAFKYPFMLGNFKGQTAGDILLRDPSKIEEMKRNRQFLKDNAEKYPKNNDIIASIDDAIFLLENGELKKPQIEGGNNEFILFKEEFKKMKVKSKNLRVVLIISCHFNDDLKWEIFIKNGEITNDNSLANKKSLSIRLNDKEFASFIEAMRMAYNEFNNSYYNRINQ
jgi:hypothetical protein